MLSSHMFPSNLSLPSGSIRPHIRSGACAGSHDDLMLESHSGVVFELLVESGT